MSVGMWEYRGAEADMASTAVVKEFPMCKDVIQESFACIRSLHSQNIHTPALEEKMCKEKKAKAAAFLKCNKNRIPGVKENNVSFFCGDAWHKFDKCLVKITEENEDNPDFPKLPIT